MSVSESLLHLPHHSGLKFAPFPINWNGCGWSQRVNSLFHTLDTLCSCLYYYKNNHKKVTW